jgi:hypothetical protein
MYDIHDVFFHPPILEWNMMFKLTYDIQSRLKSQPEKNYRDQKIHIRAKK